MLITGRDDAWQEAEVCFSKAKATSDKDAKRQWLELAEKWSELAESARIQPQFRYIPPEEL